MPKVEGPDLERYMDKHVLLKLNANRRVSGLLRGYDQFMNVVLEDTVEEVSQEERNNIGIVVVRGNSINMIEPLEKVEGRR